MNSMRTIWHKSVCAHSPWWYASTPQMPAKSRELDMHA